MHQSTISHLIPSPQSTPTPHSYGTRKRQNSSVHPTLRVRDTHSPASTPTPALQPRRIRPLGAVMPNSTNTARASISPSSSSLKVSNPVQKDKQPFRNLSQALDIEFPPKHVVLHPDDATNKVFIAVGRAFLSVGNCAMTVKDLAELTLSTGLQCQNASAAAQAITFFIRNHLQRCEDEQDCPLLLRHVLSGTARDDALAPALYSRSGGNVGKDKLASKDENGKETQERLTCFRRGTTVWYLSKAAGGPCPFARNGISLRDFSGASAFAGPESRKRDGQSGDSCTRGMKRKREREGLRCRPGRVVSEDSGDEDEEEGRRPLKVKLTLRLRPPCLETMRERSEEAYSSDLSSSDNASDSDSDDEEVMSVDETPSCHPSDFRKEEHNVEETNWTLPPYPIQRRISIPPYTPCEETYPAFYGTSYQPYISSSSGYSTSRPAMDDPSHSNYRRAPSVPLSVASPPPDSDAEDDGFKLSSSPSREFEDGDLFSPVGVKTEEGAQSWPQDVSREAVVKSEQTTDEYDLSSNDTMPDFETKLEDLGFDSLSLAWNSSNADLTAETRLSVDIKQEEEDWHQDGAGFMWDQSEPVLISPSVELQLCPLKSHTFARVQDHRSALLWSDIELLGPENVQPEEFEDGEWTSYGEMASSPRLSSVVSAHPVPSSDVASRSSSLDPIPSETRIHSRTSSPEPMSPLSAFSARSPSLSGSVQTWSSPELERASLEPSSPFYGPDLPSPSSSEHHDRDEDMMAEDSEEESTQKATPQRVAAATDLHYTEDEWPQSPITPSISRSGTIKLVTSRNASTVAEYPIEEGSTPWERGMISLCDVEDHLLPSSHSFDLPVSKVLPMQQSRTEEALNLEEPLSPQEEEVFQSLFQCPAWEQNSPIPDVSMRAQIQAVVRDKNTKENHAVMETADADEDGDENGAERKERTSRPLRRSLRVAKATASRTVKERLRKRTTAP